jgi:hypothetical protein
LIFQLEFVGEKPVIYCVFPYYLIPHFLNKEIKETGVILESRKEKNMVETVGNKRGIPSTPRDPSRSPKRTNIDTSSPMEISPESLNRVAKHLKIGDGVHFEEIESFGKDTLQPMIDDINEIICTIASSTTVVSMGLLFKHKLHSPTNPTYIFQNHISSFF